MSAALAYSPEEEFISLQEYLASEEKSPVKREYHAGRVTAMAGGTPRHAQVGFNACGSLYKRLQGKPCRGGSSDQRIRIDAEDRELYPDAVVVCPPPEYSPLDPHAIINPALIVEVTSPNSQEFDKGEKFELYAQLPAFRDYLLISQDRVLVEHYKKVEDGWLLRRYNRREDVMPISNLQIEIPLEEIYDGVDVPSGLMTMRGL